MLQTVSPTKGREYIRCRAFLLRVTAKIKQTRYLRVLSPELGLIECIEKRLFAKSVADKAYADFISNKNYYWPEYSYAECEIFAYKNKYYLKDFTLIYHFQSLTEHILAYACSQVCNDLLADLVTDKEQAAKLWPFYLYTLYALQSVTTEQNATKTAQLLSLLSIFILRLLAESGYKPDLEVIFHKGQKAAYQFNFADGKLSPLNQIESQDQQAVSAKFSTLLHYIFTCQAGEMTKINVSENLAFKLYDFAKRWLIFSLDRTYDSEVTLEKLLSEQEEYDQLVRELIAKRQSKSKEC